MTTKKTAGSRRRSRMLGATAVIMTGAFALSACGGGGAPTAGGETSESGLPVVKMQGVVADPMAMPVLYIDEEGLDEKHGFELVWEEGDPAGGTQPFLMGEAQLGPGDAISAAIANAAGHNTVAYYPHMTNTASIVASAASGIKTPDDLVGKRIGHFGSDSGTTQAISLSLLDGWGIDVSKDVELVESAPAVLPELLAQGEVDAIFDYEPYGDRAIHLTDGERIMSVAQYWQEKEGWAPPLAMLWSNRDWVEGNPEVADAVVAAFTEAQDAIIDSDYQIFKEEPYKSFLSLADDTELDRLISYCQELPCYTNTWTEADSDQMNAWIQRMVDAGMLSDYPEPEASSTITSLTNVG